MDEIGRVDEGNNEYVVYWDSEEKRPRIQIEYDFTAMRADQRVQDTLECVFGVKKRITELVVGRYSGLAFEYAMVRDLTWKELKDLGMYVTFRVARLEQSY
jgi:hypothetical protein